MKSIINYLIAVVFLLGVLPACESQWEEHTKTQDLRGKSVMEVISENPETSIFASILQKTGYDVLLSGDKMITVFAPVNGVLSGVDMNNVEALKSLVRNHLAYSNYALTQGKFSTDKVEMINEKSLTAEGSSISGISVVNEAGKYNLTTGNGILHLMNGIIPSQKNIWEYLTAESGNLQMNFIQQQNKLIMDLEKSVQIGVTPTGKPLYDTIWRNENPMLKAYPINDEKEDFTFVLLPNAVVERIEAKYAKYFVKEDPAKQDSIVRSELISDCVLAPVKITSDGKYVSLKGVKMDISTANIQETYEASNGMVYRLADADVKIYENKVKTLIVEGESYFSFYADNMNAWMMRQRPTLSGGKDMVLNSPTIFLTHYTYSDADTTMNVDINRTFAPVNATNNAGRTNNCYIQFRPTIHSVPYKIYWSAYNDYASNINLPVTFTVNTGTQTVTVDTTITAQFAQKMLISFPDKPLVHRTPQGNIENNFSPDYVFMSKRFTAGVQEEKQLYRASVNPEETWRILAVPVRTSNYSTDEDNFTFFEGNDDFGDMETIINPIYGDANILVANTAENRGTSTGMIFLDYFKLVPVVDPNE